MATDLAVKTRIDVVKKQMLDILRGLQTEYQQGKFKSPAALQHAVYSRLRAFYETIGTPTFKQVLAWGPPYSDDHNKMMEQALYDITTLYSEIQNLTKDITASFQQVNTTRQSFLKRIADAETSVNIINETYQKYSELLVFREEFSTIDKFDKTAVKGEPAYLSTDESLLTLSRESGTVFNEFATITITKGNGLPGNTKVIRSVGSGLQYDGEENMHINLAEVLDRNADTWFEYEGFELTHEAEEISRSMDFQYQEGIRWANHEEDVIGELECTIKIEFQKERPINWISLTPYIPSDRGVLPATIDRIVVSDEKGNMKLVGINEWFSKSKAYLFAQQSVKTVTIYLEQNTSYGVKVGHVYHIDRDPNLKPTLKKYKNHGAARVHAKTLPSIENLNVSYDSGTKSIVYPITKYGDKIVNEADKKKALFDLPKTEPQISAKLEQLSAKRYVIGVRDVSLASYKFKPKSEYVSIPYVSANPIQEVELDASFDVPPQFTDTTDWVSFYISIDEGRNWNQIYTKDTYKEGCKRKYLINSNTPQSGRLDEVGYIDAETDIYEIRLRILIERPTDIQDAVYYTPVIHNYELQVTASEEAE